MRFFSILILLLTLTACVPQTQKSDVSPAQHRQWAAELLTIRDFVGATEEMRLALAGNPNIDDALLYADLLEKNGDYKLARAVYETAAKYPADSAQRNTLNYRWAVLEITRFDNLKTATKLADTLPPVDSRFFDLKSLFLMKRGAYKEALEESQRAVARATNNEEKGWAYFHMAQIYYELRVERDTFGSLFNAVNNARGHSLVEQITVYWEERRHVPFPQD